MRGVRKGRKEDGVFDGWPPAPPVVRTRSQPLIPLFRSQAHPVRGRPGIVGVNVVHIVQPGREPAFQVLCNKKKRGGERGGFGVRCVCAATRVSTAHRCHYSPAGRARRAAATNPAHSPVRVSGPG